MNSKQQEFYDALSLSNEASKKQNNDILVMALLGKIATSIDKGEDITKIRELINLKNELETPK